MCRTDRAPMQVVAEWLIQHDIVINPEFVAKNLISDSKIEAQRCLERLAARDFVKRVGDGHYELTDDARRVRGSTALVACSD